jgi:hypothetical protein
VKKFFYILLLLTSCSGLQQSERDKLREQNALKEPIQRRSGEQLYVLPPPTQRIRDPYSWE